MSEYLDTLKEEFSDKDYRDAYAEDFLNTSIATQIKVLREQRDLTQEELAELIGTKQAGISRLENVNYSAWKTETLRKIARALGVRLRITFETFGTLLDDSLEFSPENLERVPFENDPVFCEAQVQEQREQIKTFIGNIQVGFLDDLHKHPHQLTYGSTGIGVSEYVMSSIQPPPAANDDALILKPALVNPAAA